MYWISYSLRLPWELLLQALYGKYIKYNINIIFIHVRVYRDFTKNSLTDKAAGIVIQSLNQVWCNRKQDYSHPAISTNILRFTKFTSWRKNFHSDLISRVQIYSPFECTMVHSEEAKIARQFLPIKSQVDFIHFCVVILNAAPSTAGP